MDVHYELRQQHETCLLNLFPSQFVHGETEEKRIRTIKQVDIIVSATSSFNFIQEGKKEEENLHALITMVHWIPK